MKTKIALAILGGVLSAMLGWATASAVTPAAHPGIASTVDGYQAGYRDGLAVCGIY